MFRSRLANLTALAALLAASVVPVSTAAGQATPLASPTAAQASTAIVVSVTNDPIRVPGSDGADHLEYDLLVTNALGAPVSLTSVEVLDADGEVLLRLAGDDLVAATQPLLALTPLQEIPGSGTVGVVLDVAVPPDRDVSTLGHRIAYELAPDAPGRTIIGSFVVDGPALTVDPRPVTVIAPPLRGGGWLAVSACCSSAALHRLVRLPVDGARFAKIETFAIDWIQIRDGRPFDGDGSRREQWYGFGAEVYAVADGTVVAVQEGRLEETPLRPTTNVHAPGDYSGNSVTIEIAPDVYAFYAHFQPGSVEVAPGDRVTSGQRLGLLGNTGNTDAPHLHFGLNDHPDPIVANSLPMVFDAWTLEGTITLETFLNATDVIPTGPTEPQTDTLQLYLDVADFG